MKAAAPRRRVILHRVLPGVSVALALGLAPPVAHAAPVVIDFGALPGAPWETYTCEGGDTVGAADGVLTIESPSCYEFSISHPAAEWHEQVDNTKGWVIETRMRLDPSSEDDFSGSVIIWANDHTHTFIFGFAPGEIRIQYPEVYPAVMDTTDDFHVYRIVVVLDRVRVYVDGVLHIDHEVTSAGQGSDTLMFGDGVGGTYSLSYWDYFWYDVQGCSQDECVPVACTEGAPCDDGNACTEADVCQNQVCAGTAITCTGECRGAGACDPAVGCAADVAPDGTPCAGGTCAAGACLPDPPPDREFESPLLYGRGCACAAGAAPAGGGGWLLLAGALAARSSRRRSRRDRD